MSGGEAHVSGFKKRNKLPGVSSVLHDCEHLLHPLTPDYLSHLYLEINLPPLLSPLEDGFTASVFSCTVLYMLVSCL